jgi:hypothetical protein
MLNLSSCVLNQIKKMKPPAKNMMLDENSVDQKVSLENTASVTTSTEPLVYRLATCFMPHL